MLTKIVLAILYAVVFISLALLALEVYFIFFLLEAKISAGFISRDLVRAGAIATIGVGLPYALIQVIKKTK